MNVLLYELNKHKSDKGTIVKGAHHYHKAYGKYFEPKKEEKINILEVGIWYGTSQQTWVSYFKNAQVYGIDIFNRLLPEQVPILQHDRMHWIKGNSRKANTVDKIKEQWGEDIQFDFIIDDGQHTPMANYDTFVNLMPFLKEDGSYFVEDAWPFHRMTSKELQHGWLIQNSDKYTMDKFNRFYEEINKYNVEEFDLRKQSGVPDSYIFRVYK